MNFLILMDNTELFFQKGFDYLKLYVKWVLNRLKIPLKSTFTDLSYIFTFCLYRQEQRIFWWVKRIWYKRNKIPIKHPPIIYLYIE